MSECTHTSNEKELVSIPAIDPSSWASRATALLVAMCDAIYNAQRRVSDRRQLQALDEYMLRDMGLDRADVEHELGKWFWER